MIAVWIVLTLVVVFGVVVFRGAPYVPSLRRDVAQAFDELYLLGATDVVVDVGSGDGVVLRMASRRGARAVGYELNPVLVLIARFLSRGDEKVSVVLRDFWVTQLPDDTTVIYGFSVSRDMLKMTAKIQSEATRLDRSLYYVSYGSQLAGMRAQKAVGAYHLYVFQPLQQGRA